VSLPARVATDAVALAALVSAFFATPERLDAARRGARSGTRRPLLPPPGRRVPRPVGGLAGRGGRWSVPRSSAGGWPAPPRSARWARRGDLRPLFVGRDGRGEPDTFGRLVLGRAGRRLAAAEPRQSVVVFGPTQSGKTSGLAVPAILGWRGPVLATSVKTDLVDDTIGHRLACGPVAVFDPAGTTGYDSLAWSPVGAARTWPMARRAATALCDGAKASAGGMSDGDFWYAAAAKLLAPLLFAAATTRRSLADVVRWVDTQETEEVLEALAATGVAESVWAARAGFARDDRQRSSVYTTVETVLDPLAGQVGGGPTLDPGGVVSAGGTLYLCAPAHDQRRLVAAFTAVTRAAIEHVYERVAATRRPLDPPLLVVLDEAANVAPLPELDGLAATAAGHGVQLVTVWHDLAQITARYGPRATTVVNNHRAKLFLSGISDVSTLDYASHLVGDEEVPVPVVSTDGRGGSTTTRSPTTRRLVTPGGVRRLRPGEALLVYGGLPPARLRLTPWTDDAVLRLQGRRRDPRPGSGTGATTGA